MAYKSLIIQEQQHSNHHHYHHFSVLLFLCVSNAVQASLIVHGTFRWNRISHTMLQIVAAVKYSKKVGIGIKCRSGMECALLKYSSHLYVLKMTIA
jgi:hypothetical protein